MGRVTALRIPCGLGRALGRDTDEDLIDEICCVSTRKHAHCIVGESYKVGTVPSVGSKKISRYLPSSVPHCHPRLLILLEHLIVARIILNSHQYQLSPSTNDSPQWQRTSTSAFTMPMATSPTPTQNQTPPTRPPQLCTNRSFKAYPTTFNAIRLSNESSVVIQPAKTP